MKRKTVEVPAEWESEPTSDEPVFVFDSHEREERDVTKPIGYSEHGRPLYAPRGIVLRWW